MVVLGGVAVSYERGTPVERGTLALLLLPSRYRSTSNAPGARHRKPLSCSTSNASRLPRHQMPLVLPLDIQRPLAYLDIEHPPAYRARHRTPLGLDMESPSAYRARHRKPLSLPRLTSNTPRPRHQTPLGLPRSTSNAPWPECTALPRQCL